MKLDPNKYKVGTDFYKEIAPYLGLGVQLAVTVVVLVFLGIWLDGQFDTQPVLTIIFSFLGMTTALYNFIKTVLKSDKK
jgi:ATP synthase protein I